MFLVSRITLIEVVELLAGVYLALKAKLGPMVPTFEISDAPQKAIL